MTRRNSDLRDAIDKLKKLKALQAKATDRLNRITEESMAASAKNKRRVSPSAAKRKSGSVIRKKAAASKPSFWQKLFGKKGG